MQTRQLGRTEVACRQSKSCPLPDSCSRDVDRDEHTGIEPDVSLTLLLDLEHPLSRSEDRICILGRPSSRLTCLG